MSYSFFFCIFLCLPFFLFFFIILIKVAVTVAVAFVVVIRFVFLSMNIVFSLLWTSTRFIWMCGQWSKYMSVCARVCANEVSTAVFFLLSSNFTHCAVTSSSSKYARRYSRTQIYTYTYTAYACTAHRTSIEYIRISCVCVVCRDDARICATFDFWVWMRCS